MCQIPVYQVYTFYVSSSSSSGSSVVSWTQVVDLCVQSYGIVGFNVPLDTI